MANGYQTTTTWGNCWHLRTVAHSCPMLANYSRQYVVGHSFCSAGEGAIVGKHRRPATKKWVPYVTTGIALEAATLITFG